jgi:hypothetical protein
MRSHYARYYALSSTKLNQVSDGLAQTSKATSRDQRRDAEGYALRDGDWRGRIEALAVFSAEANGTYADPSTLFVHGL